MNSTRDWNRMNISIRFFDHINPSDKKQVKEEYLQLRFQKRCPSSCSNLQQFVHWFSEGRDTCTVQERNSTIQWTEGYKIVAASLRCMFLNFHTNWKLWKMMYCQHTAWCACCGYQRILCDKLFKRIFRVFMSKPHDLICTCCVCHLQTTGTPSYMGD